MTERLYSIKQLQDLQEQNEINASAPDHLNYENVRLKSGINRHRINEFLSKTKMLEDMFEHHKKLKHKWTYIDSSLKIGLITTGSVNN